MTEREPRTLKDVPIAKRILVPNARRLKKDGKRHLPEPENPQLNYFILNNYEPLIPFEDRVLYDPMSGGLAIYQERRPTIRSNVLQSKFPEFSEPDADPKLRWYQYQHIGRALRASKYIKDKHTRGSGEEYIMMRDVAVIINNQLAQLRQSGTGSNPDEQLDTLLRKLEQTGILGAQVVDRKTIVKRIKRSLRHDVVGRKNPFIYEANSAVALGGGMAELERIIHVALKYTSLDEILTQEYDHEQKTLRAARDRLTRAFSLGLGQNGYQSGLSSRKRSQIETAVRQATSVCRGPLHLSNIKVSPFRERAAGAVAVLYGDMFQDIDHPGLKMARTLIGDSFYEREIAGRPNIYEVINAFPHQPESSLSKLANRAVIAARLIDEALVFGGLSLNRNTDYTYPENTRPSMLD